MAGAEKRMRGGKGVQSSAWRACGCPGCSWSLLVPCLMESSVEAHTE